MSIKLLRWTSGMAGDTVLKLLLDSDTNLQSQNKYIALNDGQSQIDYHYCKSFKYNQIAEMSLMHAFDVDQVILFDQLQQLESDDVNAQWLLKTHCYFDFLYPVVDITVNAEQMPFVIKAGLHKNSRAKNLLPNYHVLASKISDPEILYKFDCFNYAQDLLQTRNYSSDQLNLKDILSGWEDFVTALVKVNLNISAQCQIYYNQWVEENQKFMPTTAYLELIAHQNFDYNNSKLTIEERYCLLALCKQKFKILT
jgi:hypothetical protein